MFVLLNCTGNKGNHFIGMDDIDFARDKLAVIFSPSFDENRILAEGIPEVFKVFDCSCMDSISFVALFKGGELLF